MSEALVSVLSENPCQLGEGPTYVPDTDTLWWFDIVGKKLFERVIGEGRETVHDLPMMASALGVIDERRHLLVTEDGLFLRDPETGRLEKHMEIEPDRPGNRSNDARVHPSGAFWIGTMSKTMDAGAGAIHWYREGEVRTLFTDITITNSICFSPDGDVAYFADTRKNVIQRVECDPETGLPRGEATIFVDGAGGEGLFDGSICDAEGNLWNARWGAGMLDKYDAGGRRMRSIALPAAHVTCPAFLGRKADRLAVTTATIGRNPSQLAEEPGAGKTFLVELPVSGRLEPRIRL